MNIEAKTPKAEVSQAMENKDHKGTVIHERDGISVIECDLCGFAHITPLPSEEALKEEYEKEFYKKKTRLTNAEEDSEWIKLTDSDKYDIFEKHLGWSSAASQLRVLDVGSGPGYFLDVGKERSWDVLGVEPSLDAAEFVRNRGIQVEHSFFDAAFASRFEGSFDVVHLCNVLEHLRDPHEVIANIRRVMRPNGIVCITSPNDFNPLQRTLHEDCGYDAWWFAPHHHLNYFTFDSLEALIGAHDFAPIGRLSSFPLEFFLLMGDNYVGDPNLGRQLHHKRVRFDKTLASSAYAQVRKDLYDALGTLGLGRLATVFGQLQ